MRFDHAGVRRVATFGSEFPDGPRVIGRWEIKASNLVIIVRITPLLLASFSDYALCVVKLSPLY